MVRDAAIALGVIGLAVAGQVVTAYTYDVHGRLTKTEQTKGPDAGSSTTYTYDANTNLTKREAKSAVALAAPATASVSSRSAESETSRFSAPSQPVHLDPLDSAGSDPVVDAGADQ